MDSIKDLSIPLLNYERLSHAYIAGGDLAEEIAMAAVCSGNGVRPCNSCAHCAKASRGVHPDIAVVSRLEKNRNILVDQIRELRKDAIRVPGEASAKVYIINEADAMNHAAQNAFLQVLEEPPRNVVFILRTDNPKALLPTVRSRCVELRGRSAGMGTGSSSTTGEGTFEGEVSGEGHVEVTDDFFSSIEGGSEILVRLMFRLEKLDKSDFTDFLSSAHEQIIQRLRRAASDNGGGISVPRLEQVERALQRADELNNANVSVGHISGMLCSTLLK